MKGKKRITITKEILSGWLQVIRTSIDVAEKIAQRKDETAIYLLNTILVGGISEIEKEIGKTLYSSRENVARIISFIRDGKTEDALRWLLSLPEHVIYDTLIAIGGI